MMTTKDHQIVSLQNQVNTLSQEHNTLAELNRNLERSIDITREQVAAIQKENIELRGMLTDLTNEKENMLITIENEVLHPKPNWR